MGIERQVDAIAQRTTEWDLRITTRRHFIEQVLAIDRHGQAPIRRVPGQICIHHVGGLDPAKIIVRVCELIPMLEIGAADQGSLVPKVDIPDKADTPCRFRNTRKRKRFVRRVHHTITGNIEPYFIVLSVDQADIGSDEKVLGKGIAPLKLDTCSAPQGWSTGNVSPAVST